MEEFWEDNSSNTFVHRSSVRSAGRGSANEVSLIQSNSVCTPREILMVDLKVGRQRLKTLKASAKDTFSSYSIQNLIAPE